MKTLKIDHDLFNYGFEYDWNQLMESYNKQGFDAMEFDGDLNLSHIYFISLPDNLTVGGNLILTGIKIISLPNNLTVGGNLDLYNSGITTLPDSLVVKGTIFCNKS